MIQQGPFSEATSSDLLMFMCAHIAAIQQRLVVHVHCNLWQLRVQYRFSFFFLKRQQHRRYSKGKQLINHG